MKKLILTVTNTNTGEVKEMKVPVAIAGTLIAGVLGLIVVGGVTVINSITK